VRLLNRDGLHTTVNETTFNDWLLCVGPVIQAEHLNGLEFACPSEACPVW